MHLQQPKAQRCSMAFPEFIHFTEISGYAEPVLFLDQSVRLYCTVSVLDVVLDVRSPFVYISSTAGTEMTRGEHRAAVSAGVTSRSGVQYVSILTCGYPSRCDVVLAKLERKSNAERTQRS
jgi:hypothetical protein